MLRSEFALIVMILFIGAFCTSQTGITRHGESGDPTQTGSFSSRHLIQFRHFSRDVSSWVLHRAHDNTRSQSGAMTIYHEADINLEPAVLTSDLDTAWPHLSLVMTRIHTPCLESSHLMRKPEEKVLTQVSMDVDGANTKYINICYPADPVQWLVTPSRMGSMNICTNIIDNDSGNLAIISTA